MKPRRLFPYLIALALLAWILGSLARSGISGGSLLSNSYWLVYAVELLPLVALGLMVILAIYLAINAGFISDAIGTGMTRKRKQQQKKNQTIRTIIFMATWAVAIMLLWLRCGGLVCNSSAQNTASLVMQIVSGAGPVPKLPTLGPVLALASLLDTNFFAFAFLGVVVISSVIMVRAIKVHVDQTRSQRLELVETVQEQGREAAQDAIRVLDEDSYSDPRTRIMACYQKMISAAAGLGAHVGLDRTARELEKGIREMFLLKGSGIARLTGLFEEARYSLHPMTGEDSSQARQCLVEISEELSRTVSIAA